LVVDAAFAHALERDERNVLLALAQAELEIRRVRELRRAAKAAELRVEIRAQVIEHRAHHRRRPFRRGGRALRQGARESLQHLLVLRADLGALLAPEAGDALAQVRKCRHPIARLFRKISAAEKWCAFRRVNHRQRPAPGESRDLLECLLIYLVEYWQIHE